MSWTRWTMGLGLIALGLWWGFAGLGGMVACIGAIILTDNNDNNNKAGDGE